MNTCLSNDHLILFHLDELEPGERSAVAAHLLGCGACRGELQRLRATLALVGNCVNAAPVPDFTAKVMQRLAAQPPAGRRFTPWRSLASAAAVLALLITGGIWYTRPGSAPVAPPHGTPVASVPDAPAPGPEIATAPAAEPAAILLSEVEADELFDPEERELWRMLDETTAELDAAVADNGMHSGIPADAV